MLNPGPVPLPTKEAHRSAEPHRRRSGRAASLVLLVVAAVAVSGLGWALVEALEASDGDGSGGDPIFQGAGHDGASASTRADRAATTGLVAGASGDQRAEQLEGAAQFGGFAEAGKADAAEAGGQSAAGLGGRTRFSKRPRPVDLGQDGRTAPLSALATTGEVFDRPGDEDPIERPRIAPGYAEILGVLPRTPGFEAKLRRGWQIQEYNGDSVDGTAALRELWDQPELPDRVTLIALDPKTGETFTVEVSPGPLGLMLAPAYEKPQ